MNESMLPAREKFGLDMRKNVPRKCCREEMPANTIWESAFEMIKQSSGRTKGWQAVRRPSSCVDQVGFIGIDVCDKFLKSGLVLKPFSQARQMAFRRLEQLFSCDNQVANGYFNTLGRPYMLLKRRNSQ